MVGWNRIRSKLRLKLWRWHRRTGLFAALFVIFLAVTGVLLNHSHSLGLDKFYLSSAWLEYVYAVEAPVIRSYNVDDRWVSQTPDGMLSIDANDVVTCDGALVGVAALQFEELAVWLWACERELVLTLENGEIIEKLGASHGLPTPINGLAKCGENACFRAGTENFSLNLEQFSWQRSKGELVNEITLASPPDELRTALEISFNGRTITWERFLLDLHSGRLLGAWGPWLMDTVAVVFVLLAISGVTMWGAGRARR